MAYGSPERLADVPAYYADIRGGRPIAPEHLEDLVERYRRLGIEDSSPLNAITEETRAALERELGAARLHRDEALDAADRRRRRGGARRRRGDRRRPRARAALLGAVDQGLPRPAGAGARRAAPSSRSSTAGTTSRGSSSSSPAASAERTRTSSSPRTRCRRGSSTRATRTATSCSRPRALVAERARHRRQLELLLPERVADGRAVARAGHPRPSRPRSTSAGVRDVLVCPVGFVSDHLEIRWDLDVEAPGTRSGARECASSGSRCRTPIRPSCGRSRGSSGARSRYRHQREAGRDHGRARRAAVSRLPARAADAEGRPVRARPRAGHRRLGAARHLVLGRAGKRGRARRPQRLREDDAAAAAVGDRQAELRVASRSAAASARCSSSAPASIPT